MAAPRIIDYGRIDEERYKRGPAIPVHIEIAAQKILSDERPHGNEADILQMFKIATQSSVPENRIPISKLDTCVYEMSFRFGRADVVIFHIDGTASVIEVKDGSKGYNHVVSGIGQAALYATQIGMSKSNLRLVRKCLLWTSTGSLDADMAIEDACISADTVPLPWANLDVHLAHHVAVLRSFGAGHGD